MNVLKSWKTLTYLGILFCLMLSVAGCGGIAGNQCVYNYFDFFNVFAASFSLFYFSIHLQFLEKKALE